MKKQTTSFEIYKDGKLIKEFAKQTSDFAPFKWMLDHQSSSIHHAIKYEGYEVKCINDDTKEIIIW